MRTNIYVHGVPKGQDIWGCDQDRDYIRNFYGDNSDSTRFVIEVWPAKKCSFYTYLRGKNISDADGRQGSYFGITISFEGEYCTDTASLFRLCEMVFDQMISGQILLNQSGYFQYGCRSFEEKSAELENIRQKLQTVLASEFKNDVEIIDSTFSQVAGKAERLNIDDVDSPWFFTMLKKRLKIHVSPDYATQEDVIAALRAQSEPEKAKNRQLRDANDELTARLNDASQKNQSYAADLSKLREGNQKLENVQKQLSSDNERLKAELSRLREENRKQESLQKQLSFDNERLKTQLKRGKNSIERNGAQIRQPLEDLAVLPKRVFPEDKEGGRHSVGQKVWKMAHDILHVLTFIFVVCIFFSSNWHVPFQGHQPKVSVADIVMASQDSASFQNDTSTHTSLTEAPPSPKIVINGIKEGDSLMAGSSYTVSIENVPEVAQLEWKLAGATPESKRNGRTIKITVKNRNTCHISCVVGPKVEVSFPVKAQKGRTPGTKDDGGSNKGQSPEKHSSDSIETGNTTGQNSDLTNTSTADSSAVGMCKSINR